MEEPFMAVDEVESEEIADHFLCCICLDLLYKPVVLSCGHMSCFWCIHKSMNGHRKSQCPICRCPYLHFPSICRMLHFLLVKIYPDTYKRREKQTLAEERKSLCFSPQFDALVTPVGSKSLDLDSSKSESSADIEQTVWRDAKNHTQNAHELNVVADEADGAPGKKSNENDKRISVPDVLCVSCKQLLIRPIVLNCGDVYCQSCLSSVGTEKLKCLECESHHPGNLPNVCLELDSFLQEQFFNEYASRRSTTQPEQSNSSIDSSKADVSGSSEGSCGGLSFTTGVEDIHVGVGCDYCGIYPIIGDRYRCRDCIERIGFDLCKSCHECYSHLPGRFNQQHKIDHKFTLINSKQHPRNIRVFQQLGEDGRPSNLLLHPYPEQFASSPSDSDTEVVEGTELNLHIPLPEADDVDNPAEDEPL